MEDRTISLNAVIDALHQSINLFEAEDRIRDLPPVTSQPNEDVMYMEYMRGFNKGKASRQWIPVSERLPEEKQEKYLCTFDDGSIGMDWYEHCKSKWRWHSKTHRGYGTNVVAWMPLPKPYKPQESEDKE